MVISRVMRSVAPSKGATRTRKKRLVMQLWRRASPSAPGAYTTWLAWPDGGNTIVTMFEPLGSSEVVLHDWTPAATAFTCANADVRSNVRDVAVGKVGGGATTTVGLGVGIDVAVAVVAAVAVAVVVEVAVAVGFAVAVAVATSTGGTVTGVGVSSDADRDVNTAASPSPPSTRSSATPPRIPKTSATFDDDDGGRLIAPYAICGGTGVAARAPASGKPHFGQFERNADCAPSKRAPQRTHERAEVPGFTRSSCHEIAHEHDCQRGAHDEATERDTAEQEEGVLGLRRVGDRLRVERRRSARGRAHALRSGRRG